MEIKLQRRFYYVPAGFCDQSGARSRKFVTQYDHNTNLTTESRKPENIFQTQSNRSEFRESLYTPAPSSFDQAADKKASKDILVVLSWSPLSVIVVQSLP